MSNRKILSGWPAIIAILCVIDVSPSRAGSSKNSARQTVFNGTFEGGFADDGVALGWKGLGRRAAFKPNPRLGRIGGGIYGTEFVPNGHGDVNSDYQTIRLHGKVNLVDASRFDVVSKLHKQLGPEVITVAKLGPEPFFGGAHEALKPAPYTNGQKFADHCYNKSKQTGHWATAYYGLNEPHVNDKNDLAKIATFELGFTERLHAYGMKSVVLNNSTGTPGDLENMLIPEVRKLLAVADFVGYHCYGGPDGQLMCHPKSLENFSLRWRKVKQMYDRRRWPTPPMIYTEATTWGGWHDNFKPEAIRDDLIEFSKYMMQDDWTVGLSVFCTGSWKGQIWGKWNIANYPGAKPGSPHAIVDAVRQFNMDHPVDAHTGAGSQEICLEVGPANAAIVQAIDTVAGKKYRLHAWLRHEFANVWPCNLRVRILIDPTAQTTDPPLSMMSNDLIRNNKWQSDRWNRHTMIFTATGAKTSIWMLAAKPAKGRAWLYIDDVTITPD